MDERSRKRLWEDYVFHFLQKIPPDSVDPVSKVANQADLMLEAHDRRWRKNELRLEEALAKQPEVTYKKRPQGG